MPTTRRFGRVALLGIPNAGKSSLMNTIVGQPLAIISPKAQTTRAPVIGLRTEGNTQIAFLDLPGIFEPSYLLHERMRHLAIEALSNVDLVLYLHPADQLPMPTLEQLFGAPIRLRAPVIPVITKVDRLPPADAALLPKGAISTSATTGAGIAELIERLESMIPVGEWQYPPDEVGTQPLRFFVTEYLREGAFTLLEEEVPYGVTAEVEEFREDQEPVYIRASIFVDRESQKQILIGTGGSMVKAIGQHARRRLEDLLGCKVYLDLRVKVLPKWRQSAEQLRRFGL